eukprot:7504187-Alexandrium_andersonii.AAC.1
MGSTCLTCWWRPVGPGTRRLSRRLLAGRRVEAGAGQACGVADSAAAEVRVYGWSGCVGPRPAGGPELAAPVSPPKWRALLCVRWKGRRARAGL